MTAQEFEARVVAWACRRPGVVALMQIGSRAQPHGEPDRWSDWDYHLVVRRPRDFFHATWPVEIAPCWCAHRERTGRTVVKLSAVFAGGHEADFVLLSAWQMKLAYWAAARPGGRRFYLPALLRGVQNLRLIAGPGCRVLVGGRAWEKRVEGLKVPWPESPLDEEGFRRLATAFWRHAVWVYQKTARGECRAALRTFSRELCDHVYLLLEDEARAAGRQPRPEARKAEKWLDATRLAQTAALTPSLDPAALARALLGTLDLFVAAERSVAATRGFTPADHAAIEAWLRAGLAQLLRPKRAGDPGQG